MSESFLHCVRVFLSQFVRLDIVYRMVYIGSFFSKLHWALQSFLLTLLWTHTKITYTLLILCSWYRTFIHSNSPFNPFGVTLLWLIIYYLSHASLHTLSASFKYFWTKSDHLFVHLRCNCVSRLKKYIIKLSPSLSDGHNCLPPHKLLVQDCLPFLS